MHCRSGRASSGSTKRNKSVKRNLTNTRQAGGCDFSFGDRQITHRSRFCFPGCLPLRSVQRTRTPCKRRSPCDAQEPGSRYARTQLRRTWCSSFRWYDRACRRSAPHAAAPQGSAPASLQASAPSAPYCKPSSEIPWTVLPSDRSMPQRDPRPRCAPSQGSLLSWSRGKPRSTTSLHPYLRRGVRS